jgi:hypothetical protein
MFSFVPCRPGSGVDAGFARPALKVDGVINPNARMQARTLDAGKPGTWAAWTAAVEATVSEGLALATKLAFA